MLVAAFPYRKTFLTVDRYRSYVDQVGSPRSNQRSISVPSGSRFLTCKIEIFLNEIANIDIRKIGLSPLGSTLRNWNMEHRTSDGTNEIPEQVKVQVQVQVCKDPELKVDPASPRQTDRQITVYRI